MTPPTLDQVRRAASDIFSLPADKVTPQSSPETIGEWDSLRHLNLVLDLEVRFGVKFTPEEIEQMSSIGAIVKLIDGKSSS